MRLLTAACLALPLLLHTPAHAGTAERDNAWERLIEQAKAHGGVETRLDKSSSYVFQTKDGAFLSFTRLLNSPAHRSVCLIAENENATLCIAWETGKLTVGERADAATPWKFRNLDSLEAYEKEQPGVLDKLLSTVQGLVLGMKAQKPQKTGYFKVQNGKVTWYQNTSN